jgi:hypothetical protein
VTTEPTSPTRDGEVAGSNRWLFILSIHVLAAVAWYVLMPGGFPLLSGRWLANRGMPIAVGALAAGGLIARFARNVSLLRFIAFTVLTSWCAATITASLAFPFSLRRFGIAALAGVAYVAFAYHRSFIRRSFVMIRLRTLLSMGLGTALGVTAPLTQRAADPSTKPVDQFVPAIDRDLMSLEVSNSIQMDGGTLIRPTLGTVRLRNGARFIEIEPLLTFQSRSPDRFWTIFAPSKYRIGPRRQAESQFVSPAFAQVDYRDGPRGVLQVANEQADGTIEITAWSQLDEAVFSHLNTFCRLIVSGFRSLGQSTRLASQCDWLTERPTISFTSCKQAVARRGRLTIWRKADLGLATG